MSCLPFSPDTDGKCPHCGRNVRFDGPTCVDTASSPRNRPTRPGIGPKTRRSEDSYHPLYLVTESGGTRVYVNSARCPSCNKPIVTAEILDYDSSETKLVYPFYQTRFVPEEVPEDIRNDFHEATAVLSINEKASAALSRRCLQNLLIDIGANRKDNLYKQIEWALPSLPSCIRDNLHAVRTIGIFAAHPIKSEITGMIVDVEPKEAEWNLDVLEQLFDFYYVQPARAREMREKIERKR